MKHIALTETQVETLQDSLSHYNVLLKRQIAVCESRGTEGKHAADILKEKAYDISAVSDCLCRSLEGLSTEKQAYLLPDEEIRDLSEAAPLTEGGTVEDLLTEAAVVRDAVERAASELPAGPARAAAAAGLLPPWGTAGRRGVPLGAGPSGGPQGGDSGAYAVPPKRHLDKPLGG